MIEQEKTNQNPFNTIVEQIQNNGVENNDENLQKRHDDLAKKPILDSNFLTNATEGNEKNPTLSFVPVEKIVGRPFASRYPNGWAFEYDNRKGRMVTIAKALLGLGKDNTKKDEILENIFHLNDPMRKIQLDEIEGPHGPMYSVRDGTHRMGGIMVAGLEEIPCDVHKMKYPLENITNDENVLNDWKRKIGLGLIQGKIETLNGGNDYKLVVEKEILPWIRTQSKHQLIQISLMYEKLYPNSLKNLDIPRDALVDPIANNYFMDGRWEEWKQKYASAQRDNNGIVIYT